MTSKDMTLEELLLRRRGAVGEEAAAMRCPQCGSDHTFCERVAKSKPARDWYGCHACGHKYPGPAPDIEAKLVSEHSRVVKEALRLADCIDAHAAEARDHPDDYPYLRGHLDNLLTDSGKLERLMHEEAALRRLILGKGS